VGSLLNGKTINRKISTGHGRDPRHWPSNGNGLAGSRRRRPRYRHQAQRYSTTRVRLSSRRFRRSASNKKFCGFFIGPSIDILVNNSGINKISPFEEIDPEDFARIQQVNVTAPFLLCQAVIPAMKAKSWGRIVNVSSIWSIIGKPQRSSYAASKSALVGMTTTLAAEVARDGILANCVSPGPIDTELTRNVLGEDGMREIAKDIPMNRLGRAEEVAALIVWLAGSENTYISGQNIAIDGGFTRA